MVKWFYRCILTLNSTILLIAVYLIKEQVVLPIPNLNENYSYGIYILLTVLFSGICLLISNFLGEDVIEGGIVDIEPANNSYLPSYLGYFFIALSVNNKFTLAWVFVLIFIFTFNSQTLFFNPMFLLFGFKFYYVTTDSGLKIFVISRKNIRSLKGLRFTNLRRINDYTFIDWRG